MAEPLRPFPARSATPVEPLRTCLRCERVADEARKGNWPVPPIHKQQSWVFAGRRYWGGLCYECADIESRARASRRALTPNGAR